jgi:hypothetical protein
LVSIKKAISLETRAIGSDVRGERETVGSVKHFRRQLVVVMSVLWGATLLVMGLTPHQAQSQENIAQGKLATQHKRLLDEDPKRNQVAAGELLVSYKREVSEQAVDEVPRGVGGRVEKNFPHIKVQLFSFPEVKNERVREVRQQALERKKET